MRPGRGGRAGRDGRGREAWGGVPAEGSEAEKAPRSREGNRWVRAQ